MGFIFIIYYSILLFYLAFSRTTINFSLFPFFFFASTTRSGPILPGRVFFGGDSFAPPSVQPFWYIFDIGYWILDILFSI